VIAGSTVKVAQLTGDVDHETGLPTGNLTETRFRVWGTDLGNAFEHGGKLWVFFGDTLPPPAAIAVSEDTDPTDGLDLAFLTFPDDPTWYRAPAIPGVDLGGLNVPQDGISTGDVMYVWFSTDGMTRGVLARSEDDAESFTYLYDVGTRYFVNISAQLVHDVVVPGLDDGPRDWVFLFGGGAYRKGNLYVAAVALDEIEQGTMHYLSGLGEGCVPQWSRDEAAAQPVVRTDTFTPEGACVGELSVHFQPDTQTWVALYNCDFWWVGLHTAATPWGPWTAIPERVFHPCHDGGYCTFIHLPASAPTELCTPCTAGPNPTFVPGFDDVGSPYGPYVIERFSRRVGDELQLYFVMSTWNPYTVVLMTTRLAMTP